MRSAGKTISKERARVTAHVEFSLVVGYQTVRTGFQIDRESAIAAIPETAEKCFQAVMRRHRKFFPRAVQEFDTILNEQGPKLKGAVDRMNRRLGRGSEG